MRADACGCARRAFALSPRSRLPCTPPLQLTKLAAAQPGDADVLRVLAESQAAQGKFGDAAGSYRKAWQAGGQSSLDVLQGLAGEEGDGRGGGCGQWAGGRWAGQATRVGFTAAAEARAHACPADHECLALPAPACLYQPAGVLIADGKESAAADAVQAARAAGGSSGIGATELALLAGKTYAQWRGHAPDAVAIYDSLIEVRCWA